MPSNLERLPFMGPDPKVLRVPVVPSRYGSHKKSLLAVAVGVQGVRPSHSTTQHSDSITQDYKFSFVGRCYPGSLMNLWPHSLGIFVCKKI